MPHAFALSPHLDDAAFSCGGTLARFAQAGWEVTVCTAFTRSVASPSGFALSCQTDKGLPPDADYMAIRRHEDARACSALGALAVWLPLPEAPHRGYESARALFGSVRDDDAADHALASILADGPLAAPGPDLVLAPQAIGGHVDHVQAVRALRRALPPATPVLWWMDFPYAARRHTHPAEPFADEMARLPERRIIGDEASRLAACREYATQLGFQFGGEAGLVRALTTAGPRESVREHGPTCVPSSWLCA
ncbi:MAG: PIG-L family deacetylase [Acetobacteraceae bacterium]|nr:PIG-L family deacetylase [Acetobacteraceae bacterium]